MNKIGECPPNTCDDSSTRPGSLELNSSFELKSSNGASTQVNHVSIPAIPPASLTPTNKLAFNSSSELATEASSSILDAAAAASADKKARRVHMDHTYFKCVGNTPLVKITDQIYGKLETYNPTGSVKDRMIKGIIEDALSKNEIKESSVLVEATSGNTGIALSAAGAAMGLPVEIFMPCNMSQARKDMMRSFGATLHETGPNDFMAAIAQRDALLKSNVDKYWTPNQFGNIQNRLAHSTTTCPEIHNQIKDIGANQRWAAFVSGSGTGGTVSGFVHGRAELGLNFDIVMTEPTECPATHGIQGIYDGADFLMNRKDIDYTWKVSTKEAKTRAAQFARENGILIGISAGANIAIAERFVREKKPKGIVVAMLCDRGERYMDIFDQ